MHKTNGTATIADAHANKNVLAGISDLNLTRSQLERARAEISDLKNAMAEMRDDMIKINRMVGGQGWDKTADVVAAVQRFINERSNGRTAELEQQLTESDRVEKQLRTALEHEKKRADQAVESAGKLRGQLAELKLEHGKLGDKYNEQDKELQRMGRMAVTSATAPSFDEERDALLSVIDMERTDHARIIKDVLQAAADALEKVRSGLPSTENSARNLKHINYGLTLGASAVEAAVSRVLHGIQKPESETDV